MRSSTFDKVFSAVFVIVSFFMIPFIILQIIDDPKDYWEWVLLIIWVVIAIQEAVESALHAVRDKLADQEADRIEVLTKYIRENR